MSWVQVLIDAGIDVRTDGTTRAAYTTDASLFRIPPLAVAFPASEDQLRTAVRVAREHGAPLTMRGAGTSVAGNAIGPGLVIDTSRHLNTVRSIEGDLAVVDPGCVQQTLQVAAAPHGLRFGPDPSTSTRCTIGGMAGNNACGSRSLAYGRTSDNVVRVKGVWGTGTPFDTADPMATPEARALVDLASEHLGHIRTTFGQFGRQISGYALEHLLPERFDLAKFLVGSEGTLAVITELTVQLVRDPEHRLLVALGYPDLPSAGDAAPATLRHDPSACEGLDARLVDVLRERRGDGAVPELPSGSGWLFVEISGDDLAEVRQRAEALAADPDVGAVDARVVHDAAEAAALWRIRADGAGLAGRSPVGKPAWPGWEDAAVPPSSLGSFLREFDDLVDRHGLTMSPFGHFGDGCVHVRLDFDLDSAAAGDNLRSFTTDAAHLVSKYGGSLSGEHGDGRHRSELLPIMYDEVSVELFGAVKRICDPDNLLNPGVLVEPAPMDQDLRFPAPSAPRGELALAWAPDAGDLSQAVHRCTGVGKCRADNTGSGGVMCPSYSATREEKDSTRGRARVLQEMINGSLVKGWKAPEVHDALDLCLSCKGCLSDCPTGIDMASMKSEVLHQTYRGKRRPVSHYTLGRLPQLLRVASRVTPASRLGMKVVSRFGWMRSVGGVDPRRSVPIMAAEPFSRWAAAHDLVPYSAESPSNAVVLWADSFTQHFTPEIGRSMVRVLRRAGYHPVLPPSTACCGLSLISTGQLDAARATLGRLVAALVEPARAGVPIVGIEPSCTAVLRHDSEELLQSAEAGVVAKATRTLAELLTETDGWNPPDLDGVTVVAQPHCHHHAVMTWRPDEALLKRAGADVTRVGGCCGLAGNFGFEKGHYETSVAVAEKNLLPAVRNAPEDAIVLADGFSCRTQLDDLAGVRAQHLAQLLDRETE